MTFRTTTWRAAAFAAALHVLSCATGPPAASPPSASHAPENPAAGAPASDRITWTPRGAGLPARSQWRQGFDVADLNGDGPVDIVFGPPRKGAKRPGVFVGDGLGAFRFWSEATFPKVGLDYGAATTGDWNGDGLVDVAFAVHLRGFVAMVQEPGNRFAPYSDGLVLVPADGSWGAPDFSARSLATADWNGDGRPDLVALGEGPGRGKSTGDPASVRRGFRVFLNHLGTWVPVPPPVPEEEFGDSLAIGDVTGDGKPDAIIASNLIGSKRILRRGTGRSWTAEEIDAVPADALVTAVAVGRFDRDAVADVAVAWLKVAEGAWRTGIDLLYARPGRAGGFEKRPVWSEAGRLRITALAAGDLDGDSWNDLVALDGAGSLHPFLGDGKGFLTRDTSLPVPKGRAGCAGTSLLLRDMDGDGRDDAVAAFAGEKDSMSGGLDEPCPTSGAIEVWSARPR